MNAGEKVHRYSARIAWEGSTGDGYEAYSRAHLASAPPATARLDLSADPAFLGDPELLNPEQLLVAAAASCQLLSFLAACARARIDVVSYEDESEGEMPETGGPMSITRIVLRPRIIVRGGVSAERVLRLVRTAHEQCFISNSLRTEVVVEPEVEVRA